MDKKSPEYKLMIEEFRNKDYSLENVDDNLKSDREIVLEAIHHDGYELKYADDKLKADHEVVLKAIKNMVFNKW